MNFSKYLTHPAVQSVRIVAAEASVGLGSAWLILFALELVRRGAVSLYLDLNELLVVCLVAWLVGQKPQDTKPWQGYVSTAIFAILLAVLAWRLAIGQPWQSYAPLLGFVAFLRLVP